MTKGIEIKTTDTTYRPAEDTDLAIKSIENVVARSKPKMTVLDMGTGSGILGIRAAISSMVDNVIFADINPEAVSLARYNVGLNRGKIRAACSFIQTDLFSNISGKFDLIIFNAPYLIHEEKDTDLLSKAWDGGPSGVEVSISFLEQAKHHLNSYGRIILVASSHSDLRKLERAIKELGYVVERQGKEHVSFEDIISFELCMKA